MTNEKLKILCFGAGAIGSYIGGSLAVHGHEVHFLDRPETISMIRQNGIKLILTEGTHSLVPEYLWDSLESALSGKKFDFSIVAVKSFDTDSLLNSWKNVLAQIPPVLCLQNGVDNEEKIRNLIGEDNTISGTVTTAIGRIEHGIMVERLRGLGIESKNELTEKIINSFNDAGLKATAYKNPESMKWSKLLTNVTTNASCAILGMTPDEIMNNPDLFRIEIKQLREVLATMKSKEIPVVDLPGTPVKLFAMIVKNFPLMLSRIILKKSISSGRGGKMPSFYLDLMSGRMKSEVDYLNGAVVRSGQDAGVPTPVNQTLTNTLLKLTNLEIPINEFDHQPQKYLQLFSQ